MKSIFMFLAFILSCFCACKKPSLPVKDPKNSIADYGNCPELTEGVSYGGEFIITPSDGSKGSDTPIKLLDGQWPWDIK